MIKKTFIILSELGKVFHVFANNIDYEILV